MFAIATGYFKSPMVFLSFCQGFRIPLVRSAVAEATSLLQTGDFQSLRLRSENHAVLQERWLSL